MTGLDWLALISIIVALLAWAGHSMGQTRVQRSDRPKRPPVDPPSGPPDAHCL